MSHSNDTRKGGAVAYATSGTGQGEIDLNLKRFGFRKEDLRGLEATIRSFKQVKTVHVSDDWIHVEADLNHLAGRQLDVALAELHTRILQTIQHKSAVASTKQ